jgi:hypothetical protein
VKKGMAHEVLSLDPLSELRDAVKGLRRFYPEMSAAAVVLVPGPDLPHVVIPLTGSKVPNTITPESDRCQWIR